MADKSQASENINFLALLSEGPAAWAAWADEEMAKAEGQRTLVSFRDAKITEGSFAGLLFPGGCDFHGATFAGPVDFSGARFLGRADFAETTFHGAAVFSGASFSLPHAAFAHARFEAEAGFSQCVFSDKSSFVAARFLGLARFSDVRFGDDADFSLSRFHTRALFNDTRFRRRGRFRGCRFAKGAVSFRDSQFGYFSDFRGTFFAKACKVQFQRAIFSGGWITFTNAIVRGSISFRAVDFRERASFRRTRFLGEASFEAAGFERATSFSKCLFSQVPDFRQAWFARAPALGTVLIHSLSSTAWRSEHDVATKLRRLVELSEQGADHERALYFFARELEAKRQERDPAPGVPRALKPFYDLPNALYGGVSRYGQSLSRPLLVWLITGLLFMAAYAGLASLDNMGDGTCPESAGRWEGALAYAARNALPFIGQTLFDGMAWSRECLFGEKLAFVPFVFTAAQQVISLLLFFVLILALRNRFRVG